jgi:tetratricopeptide (TPR) repeat protein
LSAKIFLGNRQYLARSTCLIAIGIMLCVTIGVPARVGAQSREETLDWALLFDMVGYGGDGAPELLELRLKLFRAVHNALEDAWHSDLRNDRFFLLQTQIHHHAAEALMFLGRKEDALKELEHAKDDLRSALLVDDICFSRCSEICSNLLSAWVENGLHASRILDSAGYPSEASKAIGEALSMLAGNEREATLSRLLRDRLSRQDFENALAVDFEAIEVAGEEKDLSFIDNTIGWAWTIAAELFYSISWNPETGEMRDGDPRDFIDGIKIGIGKTSKYGMRNQEEDRASFGGVFFSSRDDKEHDLLTYVHEQMNLGNFEPAAKYLFFAYVDKRVSAGKRRGIRCLDKSEAFLSFDEVLSYAKSKGEVSDSTIQAIMLFQVLGDFLEKHCREPNLGQAESAIP